VRVGVVLLPEHPWPRAKELWQRVEQLGFDHAWTYDHLSWRSLRDDPWHSATATLSAAAVVTERVRLGTLVASPNFRHPVPTARELITMDDLSQGRFEFGIGAGGVGWDATTLGQEPWSPTERADRFEEFVVLSDLLLRQPTTTWKGRYYAAHEARNAPGCVQGPRLPFVIAAGGPRGMRIAVEHGQTWVTVGTRDREGGPAPVSEGVATVREQLAKLDEACAKGGRDPQTLKRMVLTGLNLDSGVGSLGQFEDTLGRYAELGVTDYVVHWPRPTPPYQGDEQAFIDLFERRAQARS
jgi:alkanesulfonate monooxygenase SsuD/methylene tetrahydromethanopterin reductase-like flavin-dependent oxidoreductase (luciferase family)